ncbi:MAG: hypothetical protein HY698_18305 [Deltaproteobacteria bacterium]|nr:hypothetical protein [Deltaproteobacteria bacterium]
MRSMRLEPEAMALALLMALPTSAMAQSTTNGVGGGYVGSDHWLRGMTQTGLLNGARNEAERYRYNTPKIKGSRSKDKRKETRTIALHGKIVFPEANPFPRGRFPTLLLTSRNHKKDSVEHSAWPSEDGTFHAELIPGQTYDVSWMYTFGEREQFAVIRAPAKGKEFDREIGFQSSPLAERMAKEAEAASVPHVPPTIELSPTNQAPEPPSAPYGYGSPQSAGGYQPPVSAGGYQPPQSSGGYRPPVSSGGWKPPQSSGNYSPPR